MTMTPLRFRRAALGGGIALTALTAPLLAVLPGPAHAEQVILPSVSFVGCQITVNGNQLPGETTWSPTLTIDVPTAVASGNTFLVKAQLGDLPANTFPDDLTNVEIALGDLRLVSENVIDMRINDAYDVASFDTDQPLAFQEFEYEFDYVDPRVYHHRIDRIALTLYGTDSTNTAVQYDYECDPLLNAPTIFDIAVYDLNGTPGLTLGRTSAQVGQTVSFAGTNLLAAAPSDPPAQATVTVGGKPAGLVDVDGSGAVVGTFVVPTGLSGTVEVRVTNGAKSASRPLTISGPTGNGGVNVNNPSTWHLNAQGDVVNNLAKVKVASKKVRSGKKLKLGGSGFAPGEAVIVKAKALKARSTKGKTARLFTKVVYANAAGAIKAALKLKKAAKGKWRVTAIGIASGRGGVATFKVK